MWLQDPALQQKKKSCPTADLVATIAVPNPANADTVGHEAVDVAGVVVLIVGGGGARIGIGGEIGRQQQQPPPFSGQQGAVGGLDDSCYPCNRMTHIKF